MTTKKYTLPFFGELNLDALEEYYDADFEYGDRQIYIDLNFDNDSIAEEKLIGVKSNLENLPSIIEVANRTVEEDFFTGETTKDYIEHHLEVISEEELADVLKDSNKNVSPELQLFSILKLYRIGFYPGEDDAIVMDFSIGKGITDYIVVVNLNDEGAVNSVVMES